MSDGSSERRHIFISHHHKDDANVDAMTNLLGNSGCDIRNSSIRALRPENQARMKNGMVKDGKRPADHIGPMRHSGRQRLGSRLVRLAGSVVGRRRSTSRR